MPKLCPRCGRKMDESWEDGLPILSRRDSETKICSSCWLEEGYIDEKIMSPTINELNFLAKLKKQQRTKQRKHTKKMLQHDRAHLRKRRKVV